MIIVGEFRLVKTLSQKIETIETTCSSKETALQNYMNLSICQFLRDSLGFTLIRSKDIDQLTSLDSFCFHVNCLLSPLGIASTYNRPFLLND